MLTGDALIALVLFIFVYAIIVSEKIHRTKIALAGAVGILLFKIMPQDIAISFIDFNTLGLLIGMMIIVAICRRTGMFQYMAIKAAKKVKGDPIKLLLMFFLLTAVASAFLDNVTTVLLFTSVIFAITDVLNLNPIPFLISEIFASNIGGTATLIGDPPNVMIGSAANLGFNDFIVNLFIPIMAISLVIVFLFYLIYRNQLVVDEQSRSKVMELNENELLTQKSLLWRSLGVLILTIVGFSLHQSLHLESATIALTGAALLLLISDMAPEDVLVEIEWNSIFFFIGLFVLVGGLQVTGIINLIAKWSLEVTQGNMVLMNFLVLWMSAIASAFIDNIPFVATMIPLIKAMAEMGNVDVSALWWTLSLGACLGGNGTLIGASANVVVSSIAASHGRPISYKSYFCIGFPLMIVSILIANIYVYFAYLR